MGVCMAETPLALEMPDKFNFEEIPAIDVSIDVSIDASSPAVDFIKGFLKGIGETKSAENLVKCLHDVEAIFHKIIEALHHLKHMKLREIIKGLKMLFDVIKKLMSIIKPCTAGYDKLKKLIHEVAHPNIMQIAMRIIAHPTEFISDIMTAIGCFKAKNFEGFGKALGDMLKIMFLSKEAEAENNAIEFVKGFLEGIGETKNIEKLLKCLKDLEGIFVKIMEALEYLQKMTFKDIIHGLRLFFDAVRKLMDMLKPCTTGYTVLEKLIEEITHPDITKIAMRIMMHSGEFIQYIMTAIGCFQSKDFKCFGKGVGGILRIMFLTRKADADKQAVDFVEGFLDGIREWRGTKRLLDCIDDCEVIFQQMFEALQHIKKMKYHEITKGLIILFKAVQKFMSILLPCSYDYPVLEKLMAELAHPNVKKMTIKILLHSGQFIHDIMKGIECFQSHNKKCAGKSVGDIMRIMFLTRKFDEQ